MLNQGELRAFYVEYACGAISSNLLQTILRDEVPVPECSLVESIAAFVQSRDRERENDLGLLLQTSMGGYLRLICILGNSPEQMSFTSLIRHALEYGAESTKAHREMTPEGRSAFWSLVEDLDLAMIEAAE